MSQGILVKRIFLINKWIDSNHEYDDVILLYLQWKNKRRWPSPGECILFSSSLTYYTDTDITNTGMMWMWLSTGCCQLLFSSENRDSVDTDPLDETTQWPHLTSTWEARLMLHTHLVCLACKMESSELAYCWFWKTSTSAPYLTNHIKKTLGP